MTTPIEEILGSGANTPAPVEASKEPVEQTPEAAPDTPVEPEAVGGEQSVEQRQGVPVAALQAERQKVKRYTEEVAEFRAQAERQAQELAQLREMLSGMQRTPAPAPQEQAVDPTDLLFTNPTEFIARQLQEQMAPMRQAHYQMAREFADSRHTPDVVKAAIEEFDRRDAAGALHPAEAQRVKSAANPFDEAVKWHAREKFMADVQDPAAYRDKIKAEVMAELQAREKAPAPAPVMPTDLSSARNSGSRAGPAWAGPAPLSEILSR